jgi:hypothetical protein
MEGNFPPKLEIPAEAFRVTPSLRLLPDVSSAPHINQWRHTYRHSNECLLLCYSFVTNLIFRSLLTVGPLL